MFFSDFEALGAQVHVVIDHKDENGNISNLYNFVKGGAGYEYPLKKKKKQKKKKRKSNKVIKIGIFFY